MYHIQTASVRKIWNYQSVPKNLFKYLKKQNTKRNNTYVIVPHEFTHYYRTGAEFLHQHLCTLEL